MEVGVILKFDFKGKFNEKWGFVEMMNAAFDKLMKEDGKDGYFEGMPVRGYGVKGGKMKGLKW